MKSITGILVASVVVYLWGFLFWGTPLFDFVYEVGKESPDPTAARKALSENFPEDGVYFVPSMKNAMKDRVALHKEGPIAFVYMADKDGGPMMNMKIMAMGFVLLLVTHTILLVLIKFSCSKDSFFLTRFLVVSIAGLAAAVGIHGGDMVWWMEPISWKAYQAIYQIIAWALAGVILAWFTGKSKPRKTA